MPAESIDTRHGLLPHLEAHMPGTAEKDSDGPYGSRHFGASQAGQALNIRRTESLPQQALQSCTINNI